MATKITDIDIPVGFLAERLDLIALSGALIWKSRSLAMFDGNTQAWKTWNKRFAGKPAGSVGHQGYRFVMLTHLGRSRLLRAHRIIYALTHGRWPPDQVDHENRERATNEIDNLRESTQAQNSQNQNLSKRNTSGIRGVSQDTKTGKWRVQIKTNYRNIKVGGYDTRAEAREVRAAAEMVLHPFRPKPPPIDPLTLIPDGVMVTGCWKIEGKTRKVPRMDKPTFTKTDRTIFTFDEVGY